MAFKSTRRALVHLSAIALLPVMSCDRHGSGPGVPPASALEPALTSQPLGSLEGEFDGIASLEPPVLQRVAHAAIQASDGDIVVIGGMDNLDQPIQQAIRFDIDTQAWTSWFSLPEPRYEHAAVTLPDESILVVGGYETFGVQRSLPPEALILRADAHTWSAMRLSRGRTAHSVTVLTTGAVLVSGGASDEYSDTPHVELFDPSLAVWRETSPLRQSRAMHASILLQDGRVLATGGATNGSPTPSTEIFTVEAESWIDGPDLLQARWAHGALVLRDGRVLVVGGVAPGGESATAEVWRPGESAWQAAGSLATARSEPELVLLADGRVLVLGGEAGADFPSETDVFDPISSTWQAGPTLQSGRTGHTATLLPDGRVLVVGGWNGSTFPDPEILDIP